MSYWKPRISIAGLATIALLAISCSSSSAGGSADGSAADGTIRGVTENSITIGGVAQLSSYEGIDAGVRARFERANREGGVNGRQIDFIGVKDDGSDAGRNLDVTRELIEADQVFAVAPVASQVFLPQSSDLLARSAAPFVGWGFMPGFCDNDFGYGFNGCLVGDDFVNSGLTDPVLETASETLDMPTADLRIAIQTGDDSTGMSGAAQYADTAEKRGAEVVYNEQTIPADTQTTDYSPFAQAIIESNPDVVYASAKFADVIGLTGALKQAGFDGPVVNFVTYVPGLLEAQPEVAAAIEGAWINSQFPASESDSPAVQQIRDDLEEIGEEPFITLGSSVGYWSADLLVQQLEAAGKDLTPETFRAAMEDFTYEPIEGGIGPVSFPDDQTQATPCAALVEVEDGAYGVLRPMTCYESYAR